MEGKKKKRHGRIHIHGLMHMHRHTLHPFRMLEGRKRNVKEGKTNEEMTSSSYIMHGNVTKPCVIFVFLFEPSEKKLMLSKKCFLFLYSMLYAKKNIFV
jgi:hypothetical protein